jgi:hypothetical protein
MARQLLGGGALDLTERRLSSSLAGYVCWSDPNGYSSAHSEAADRFSITVTAGWDTQHVADLPRWTWRVKDAYGSDLAQPSAAGLWSLVRATLFHTNHPADASYLGQFLALGDLAGDHYVFAGIERVTTGSNTYMRLTATQSGTTTPSGGTAYIVTAPTGSKLVSNWLVTYNNVEAAAQIDTFLGEYYGDDQDDNSDAGSSPLGSCYGFDAGGLYLHMGAYSQNVASPGGVVEMDGRYAPPVGWSR